MRRALTLPLLVTTILAVTALGVAGDPQDAGGHHDAARHHDGARHHDEGRFTAQVEGFPPQLRDITASRPLPQQEDTRSAQVEEAAVATALADPRVASRVGGRHAVLGATQADAKATRPGSVEVAVYAHEAAATVLATVVGDRVVGLRAVPAGRWQPPLAGPERVEAIAIAREALVRDGHARAHGLDGFAIHALEPDGTPFDTRMAYVTFHADVDARPELTAWVDLTAGRVVRSSVQVPPAGAHAAQAPPTQVRQQPSQGAGEAVVGVRPGRLRGHVRWHGWSFEYDLSPRVDGVSLSAGTYRGVEVFARLSMPAMTVFYDHPPGTPQQSRCGPYVDRLGPPEVTPVPWFDDRPMVLREITVDGVDWLEIGILDTLGNYVLYQSWYVSEDGQIDAHTFAKGLQCEFDHVHYPFWRFDLDLAGPGGDRITRALPGGGREVMPVEFVADASTAAGHGWVVEDIRTRDRVHLDFDDGTWTVPGEVVPQAEASGSVVYGRLARGSETGEWRAPAATDLGQDEGEAIDDADVVVWYRGLLPHSAVEGPSLWHSTGVRLRFEITPRYQARPGSRGG